MFPMIRLGFTVCARARVFVYQDAKGHGVRARTVLSRIKRLVIPPAWRDVWICPSANGHIQAVGRDHRGRKQYRYHDRWDTARDAAKFSHLRRLGRRCPPSAPPCNAT